ncbi:MAG: radical SAM protein [Thermoanaerobaculia bacterium]
MTAMDASTAPAGGPDLAALDTEGVVRELLGRAAGSSKGAFLSLADEAQRVFARRLGEAYGSEAFGRLMALKVVNLAVARHHFGHRHTALASRPVQLMLDPANNCHLSCPGCVHTANATLSAQYDWPGGLLSPATYDAFLRDLGPTAFGAVFYNYGEPMLNKRTPAMIRAAKNFLLHTCMSTNFSLPVDVEALVDSGLNFLFLSIDGASQDVYARFRRGGDLALCLENTRRLLAARERQGSNVPYVLWRFLTFEHNLHEVDEAIRIATDIGVDQISITTPFAVDWDDPGVKIARSEREGIHLLRPGATFKGRLDDWREVDLPEAEIAREFARPWADRLGGGPLEEPSRGRSSTCAWLYQSLTIDARGRVTPCCMTPEQDSHRVYGSYPDAEGRMFNQPDYQLSRLAFADRAAYERREGAVAVEEAPFCAICTANPELTYTLERDVSRDLSLLDNQRLVSAASVGELTNWQQSR